MAAYEPIVYPINGSQMWPKTGLPSLKPPKIKRQAGRPKKLRKRQFNEPRDSTHMRRDNKTTKCSVCGSFGHNKRGCKGQGQPPSQQRQSQVQREKLQVILLPFVTLPLTLTIVFN